MKASFIVPLLLIAGDPDLLLVRAFFVGRFFGDHRRVKPLRLSSSLDFPSRFRLKQHLFASTVVPAPKTDLPATNAVDEKHENAGDDKSNGSDVISAFDALAGNTALCLVQSDLKRADGVDGSSTGWTGWIDEASAFRLQKCVENIALKVLKTNTGKGDTRRSKQQENGQDDFIRFTRWIKMCPVPCQVELSDEFQLAVNRTLDDDVLNRIDSMHDDFLNRIGCRLISLPSAQTLSNPLKTQPGGIVYGKLLYGGVNRFRLIGGNRSGRSKVMRRVGERRAVLGANPVSTSGKKVSTSVNVGDASWLQYGGPERNYEAVDMGPCLVLEVTLLPKGLEIPKLNSDHNGGKAIASMNVDQNCSSSSDLMISQIQWDPNDIFDFIPTTLPPEPRASNVTASAGIGHGTELKIDTEDPMAFSASLSDIESAFCSTVGGLRPQTDEIVRRVLDGRALRPFSSKEIEDDDSYSNHTNSISSVDCIRRQEMEELLALGLQPVKGLLLYGPPGCGKTALAREISHILDAVPPKIVSAPELLDRWVGGSEKLVRELFADAEAELKACNGDATRSSLHVVVIDEIDAVFRKRGASEYDNSGEVTRASAVNQILAKLDGITALGNVLVIGMTNRKELLDPALLRPGRLEVHVEIPLPNEAGRREILQIHFAELRKRGRLSEPLCQAIDGCRQSKIDYNGDIVNTKQGAKRWRRYLPKSFSPKARTRTRMTRIRDLAADRWTSDFSGADLAGLVRCAGSIALERARRQDLEGGNMDGLLITVEDVARALEEIRI